MTNPATPYWMRQTKADLLRHEGFREFAYPDPLSYLGTKYRKEKWGYVPAAQILMKIGESPTKGTPWTVGIGFTKGVNHHSRMGPTLAMYKLEEVVLEHLWILDKAVPGWLNAPDFAKTVMANLAFNLGNKLFTFKNTLKLLKAGKYAEAGANLQQSLWYKQVGGRAVELVKRLKTGQIAPAHRVQ